MYMVDNATFKNLVYKEFDFLKSKYGFKFSKYNIGENVTARKGDIQIQFVREYGTQNVYINIQLKGQLGRKASKDSEYRKLGLGQIMRVLTDKDEFREHRKSFNIDLKIPEDYVQRFNQEKLFLVRYCDSLFQHGDLTNWWKTIEYLSSL